MNGGMIFSLVLKWQLLFTFSVNGVASWIAVVEFFSH
jgi:hypothetical protein